MLKDTRFETERLMVRPFDIQDLEPLHQILSQQEVFRYMPDEAKSLEETRKVLAWLIECYKKNTPERITKLTLAVVWKQDQKLTGWCGLGPLEFAPQDIEIYYGFSKYWWGRGIATEAAKAVLDFGFKATKLDRIVAIVRPENPASVRVIEKIGLVYEKTLENLPEKHRWFDGCLYFSILREDYFKKSQSGET
jgi:ribosomal-protein-alanine N-acetyltransferase